MNFMVDRLRDSALITAREPQQVATQHKTLLKNIFKKSSLVDRKQQAVFSTSHPTPPFH